ncbi:MAG TPA: AAA family ATPase [Microvirga sp.]|jgi:hypothetical protein
MRSDAIDPALARVAAALARAEGRREALEARAAALTRDIELAKGRLAVRGEVEAFIEAVQRDASQRNLAAFETLLTALVQEVLPGEKPVCLDLSTERGLAALDICVRRPDGSLEDVLEDNGGALTNVIGMALRLIAVVKADVGRFLALDEADCWIAPDRVPAFYRVLEDGAARLGVQCFAVSHHDLAEFGGEIHIARITGEPVEGVGIAAPNGGRAWAEEMPGLRFIRLVNVQGYRDATLPLSPGVNALIGPNNRGKSTFIRALRAVFYGEARDSLVRAGEKAATIEIGLAAGRTLRFTRQPRRTPVNVWSLHEADGSIVEEGGTRFETGGRAVPPWVESLLRITKVEDLDVHIAHQKFPVFLLGETPSRRSAVLSIGQEGAYARDMLQIHKERCRQDNDLVKTGERELIATRAALARLQELDALGEALARARLEGAALAAAAARIDRLEGARSRLLDLGLRLRRARARADGTADLPAPEHLADLQRSVERARDRQRIGRSLLAAKSGLRLATARAACLEALPAAMPDLRATAREEQVLASFGTLRRQASAARDRLGAIEAEIKALRTDMTALLDRTDGLCPTCGSQVDADTLLGGHAHAGQAAA